MQLDGEMARLDGWVGVRERPRLLQRGRAIEAQAV